MNKVREQYENFPYPFRNPNDEYNRLIQSPVFTLAAIDHMVFGGTRDWTRPLRILVAGAGTGDAVIAIAQNMLNAHVPGEVVYLDLSTASRQIAEDRARIRKLNNILFRSGSILDLSANVDGYFDFINCTGVLHHLEDPSAGLHALSEVLAPDGGMNLMVYATLGRAGVYSMQRMLRQIAPPSMSPAERVAVARRLVATLPQTNLLSRSSNITDHRVKPGPEGDAGIFDLLLHSCDRSYTIGQFNDLVTSKALRISGFFQRCLYEPAFWCQDTFLLEATQDLDPIAKASFTEDLLGFIKQHVVFVVRAGNSVSQPEMTFNSVPVWAAELTSIPAEGPFDASFSVQEIPMSLHFSELEANIFRLIDSRKSIGEIFLASGLPESEFVPAIRKVCASLHAVGVIFLRA